MKFFLRFSELEVYTYHRIYVNVPRLFFGISHLLLEWNRLNETSRHLDPHDLIQTSYRKHRNTFYLLQLTTQRFFIFNSNPARWKVPNNKKRKTLIWNVLIYLFVIQFSAGAAHKTYNLCWFLYWLNLNAEYFFHICLWWKKNVINWMECFEINVIGTEARM